MFTANWLTGRQAAEFRPYGLTLPQYNILRILARAIPAARHGGAAHRADAGQNQQCLAHCGQARRERSW
ncbi:MAG: hypothetical protein WKG07_43005 [Hymenobacter sp.]